MKKPLLLISLLFMPLLAAAQQHEIDIDVNNETDNRIIFYIVYTKPDGEFSQKLFEVASNSRQKFHHVNILPKSLEPPSPHWFVPMVKPTYAYNCRNGFSYNPAKPILHAHIKPSAAKPLGECEVF